MNWVIIPDASRRASVSLRLAEKKVALLPCLQSQLENTGQAMKANCKTQRSTRERLGNSIEVPTLE